MSINTTQFRPVRARLGTALTASLLLAAGTAAFAQDDAGDPGPGAVTDFQTIEAPETENTKGVFVTQIGTTNRSNVEQQDTSQLVELRQDGSDNTALVQQRGTGDHVANIVQSGDLNSVEAAQEGSGASVLLLAQEGIGNSALTLQRDDTALGSAAAVLQRGNQNSLILIQDGSDNQARLTQDGDNNTMTATQLDAGNRLEWNQLGSGLSDLQITQTGGGAIEITQSNTGAAFPPPPGGG